MLCHDLPVRSLFGHALPATAAAGVSGGLRAQGRFADACNDRFLGVVELALETLAASARERPAGY